MSKNKDYTFDYKSKAKVRTWKEAPQSEKRRITEETDKDNNKGIKIVVNVVVSALIIVILTPIIINLMKEAL